MTEDRYLYGLTEEVKIYVYLKSSMILPIVIYGIPIHHVQLLRFMVVAMKIYGLFQSNQIYFTLILTGYIC